jgi:hypothetical protein
VFPQIFCLSLCIFALALVGVFYPYNRGALFTALIVLYALTACIAGYISTSYYMQVRAPNRCMHSPLRRIQFPAGTPCAMPCALQLFDCVCEY